MKNKKIKSIIFTGVVLVIFSICVIQLNENIIISTGATNDNKTIGWG